MVQELKHSLKKLPASEYVLMKGNDFKLISRNRFAESFGQEKAKGTINTTDLAAIKKITAEYEDASPKILKRFGLV